MINITNGTRSICPLLLQKFEALINFDKILCFCMCYIKQSPADSVDLCSYSVSCFCEVFVVGHNGAVFSKLHAFCTSWQPTHFPKVKNLNSCFLCTVTEIDFCNVVMIIKILQYITSTWKLTAHQFFNRMSNQPNIINTSGFCHCSSLTNKTYLCPNLTTKLYTIV